MAFERVWKINSRSSRPKAKSTNYMPTRTSKKSRFLGQQSDYVKLKSSRFRGRKNTHFNSKCTLFVSYIEIMVILLVKATSYF